MRRSSYNYKDRPTWFKEISLYFYEVIQTRKLPYCLECVIALVKADKLPINKLKEHFSGHLFYLGPLSLCAKEHFRLLHASSLYNATLIIQIKYNYFQTPLNRTVFKVSAYRKYLQRRKPTSFATPNNGKRRQRSRPNKVHSLVT